jgi:hypothetical protein
MLNPHQGYSLLFILPLTFFISFNVFLWPSYGRSNSFTIACIIITAFIRYVVLALSYAFEPCYNVGDYITHNAGSISNALIFMSYELLFISLYCYLFIRRNVAYNNLEISYIVDYHISNNFFTYLYIIICFVFVAFNKEVFGSIHFLRLSADTDSRVAGETLSTTLLIARQFFQTGLILSFTVFACYLCRSYLSSTNSIYVYISVLAALIVVSFIIGEQRAVQVYVAFATIFFLCRLFPRDKKMIITSISFLVVFVITFLTIYKTFYAFRSGSYQEALSGGFSALSLSYQFEIYALGPVSVSAVFDLLDTHSPAFFTLILDFLRSTIGPSFFVKKYEMGTTSVLYNLFITQGTNPSGFLIPISAQGAMYLTPFFGPLLICLYYRLAFWQEKIIKKTANPYICVFIGFMYIRFATCMVTSNINTINTMASLVVIFLFPLFIVHKVFYNGK